MSKGTVVALPAQSLRRGIVALCFFLLLAGCALAQDSAALPNPAVPNLVKFTGTISSTPAGAVGVIFALYQDQTGGAPLWQEVQSVTLDTSGRYTALLGSSSANGIPVDLFSSNAARWLGVQVQGQAEQARVLLVSVPYALKAADAQTLGGLPPSAFLRADAGATTSPVATTSSVDTAVVNAAVSSTIKDAVTNPTHAPVDDAGWLPGYLPVFDANGNLQDSFLYESGTAANPLIFLGSSATGTPAPIYNLQFIATVNPASVDIDGYGDVMGINFLGRRAEGTLANPMQVLTDDNLMAMGAFGWFQSGTTGVKSGFSPYTRASMKFFASQPWTDTAQGTYISLATTPNNTAPNASAASTTERMRIDDLGNVGIGTTTPTGAASTTTPVTLEVNGTVKLTKSSGGGIIFQDGTALNSAVNLPSTAAGNTFNGSQTINGFETVVDSIYSDGSVYVDASHNNSGGSVVPGLNFGGFGTGEGIASNRNSGVNVYGLDFYTNRTRQMSITNSGQVGIGTATPGAQLEVDSAGANAVIVGDAFGKSSTGSGFTGAISGVWGDDGDKTYTGGTGVLGTSDVNFAGYFINNNTTYIPAIWAEDDESTNAKQVVFETIGGHYGGGCEIDVSGNLVCTGAVTAAVAVASGAKQVAVYGVQSAENWLEDAGGGQLSNGAARVEFEPTFAQTVNGAAEYRVFLTPNGDCNGLYVSAKTATGFEVHELGGGKSSIAFDYRIMAKRTGYENVRLEDLTEQFKRQKSVRGMAPHPAAVSTAEAR